MIFKFKLKFVKHVSVFDPDGPMYAPMADAENPAQRIEGSAETLEELETPTGRIE